MPPLVQCNRGIREYNICCLRAVAQVNGVVVIKASQGTLHQMKNNKGRGTVAGCKKQYNSEPNMKPIKVVFP